MRVRENEKERERERERSDKGQEGNVAFNVALGKYY